MNQDIFATRRRLIIMGLVLLAGLLASGRSILAQPPVVIPPGTPLGNGAAPANASATNPVYKIQGVNDRLKMVVNTSRFITLDKRIPQVQVNNPDILDVQPMTPNQVQISAKKTGVTQVNLWSEDKQIYSVTVIVMGDAEELSQILREQFPNTALSIVPLNNAVMIKGFVDQQDAVPRIITIAEQYYPKVINAMVVSGVQQGLLHVKVVEVSRTKLRNLGFDFAHVSSNGNIVMSGVNGLLSTASGAPFGVPGAAPDNVLKFSLLNGGNSFYGVLNALREDKLAKITSEPDLVAISGRPAYMLSGGELGYQTTNALTGTTVGFKEYGTRLDFVPTVLGNGRLKLDVRARVSQPDAANSINGIPAIKTREVETGVELRAGQTLAIAGLMEQRLESSNHGLPWISEVPYLGVPFRSVSELINEVELVILVTPEIVDGMEPGQVPTCLPGMQTTSPSDWELFFKGHLEVPNCCPADGTCDNCPPSGVDGSLSRQSPQNRARGNDVVQNQRQEPGFIGPIGYDVLK